MSETRAPRRLEGLAPAAPSAERFKAAEEHRRRVKRLKILLPLLALACVAAIFISLVVNRRPESHVTGGTPAIEMDAPALKGLGENGKPFEITAAQATQTRAGLIELIGVRARIELDDGVATLSARAGSFDQQTSTATVEGLVKISLDDVYRFETDSASADVKAGIITGNQPVRAWGPMGTIEAAGFKVEKSVKRVTFTGGVTSVINPEAAAPQETP